MVGRRCMMVGRRCMMACCVCACVCGVAAGGRRGSYLASCKLQTANSNPCFGFVDICVSS